MRKTAVLSIIIALAILAVGATGCGTAEKTHTLVLERYGLTWVPKDAQGHLYMNVPLIQADEYLGQSFREANEDDEELRSLGIDISQMDQAVLAYGMDSGEASVALGRFDFDYVREQLRGQGLTGETYLDTEFWAGDLYSYAQGGVALFANGLAWGDEEMVRSLVRVITGAEPSICDTADVEELSGRLPTWTPFVAMLSLDPAEDLGMLNAQAAAFVFAKEDEDSIRFAWAVEFNEPDEATKWYDAIKGEEGIRASVATRFVSYEGTMTLEEFVSEFF